eukprot:TRINITY_DN2652_c0_g1_i1.p2 TRINITY_DN2652_c0_g1~~TRINITY_DN2652_c0_g1_i1.p2  ORF type:complete len:119 (+),score=9.85 TRINITY_DN2652_c0_g1_i1:1605-1961(+)
MYLTAITYMNNFTSPTAVRRCVDVAFMCETLTDLSAVVLMIYVHLSHLVDRAALALARTLSSLDLVLHSFYSAWLPARVSFKDALQLGLDFAFLLLCLVASKGQLQPEGKGEVASSIQ